MSVAADTTGKSFLAALLAAPLLFFSPVDVAAEVGEVEEPIGFERTPPRLSLVDGEASFWRPGAEDWTQAQINTPLAAGDELYTGPSANLEIQVGSRAFVRAGQETQVSIYALEPDYLQLRVAAGDLSLDLRSLKSGQTLEVGTPNAAFTVEAPGYYRLTVDATTSSFISRRGGRAVATPASGAAIAVGASERVVVTGGETPRLATYAAPEIDTWDRWNYARTDRQLESVSARYVSEDVYGLADLDNHGDWRQVPTYGAVWVPRRVAVDWAPYSYGRWIYDPFYGWSWVDYAPWGWAPFHYGRWVHVSGVWGWCPGPVVVRPYYAPALVAFYGGPSFSVGVSIGAPFGWVALGWGEPLAPWWGPARFRNYAYWAGWGGPRYVNNVYINNKTIIHVDRIRHHDHARRRRGVVVVDRDTFGRRRVEPNRRWRGDVDDLRPVRGEPMRPHRDSLRPGDRAGRRPPRELLDRRVVSTREPRIARVPVEQRGGEVRGGGEDRRAGQPSDGRPDRAAPRVVESTRQQPLRETRRAAPELGAAPRRDESRRDESRNAPPPRLATGDDAAATRGERRASRFEDAARREVDRSLRESRNPPEVATHQRQRESARQAPPLPSRDNPSWQGADPPSASSQRPDLATRQSRRDRPSAQPLPSRETATRQSVEPRPDRAAVPRRATDGAVRESRRAAPPPLPRSRDRRGDEAAVSRAGERQRVEQPSRELRAAPAPAVRERRQVERQPQRQEDRRVERSAPRRAEAPAARQQRQAPAVRQPQGASQRPRASAPAYRAAPRRVAERRSSVRMQPVRRADSVSRLQPAPRMPRTSAGSLGNLRGQRSAGGGERRR